MKLHILFLTLFLATTVAGASRVTTYTVILGGNKAGLQSTEIVNDREMRFAFEYNDRGRGPKFASHFILDDDGFPASVEISGNDYFKGAFEERFDTKGGKAS